MTDFVNQTEIAKGAIGCYIPSNRFKTARISVTAYLPLNEDNIATASLMAQILSNGCARFAKPLDMSRELDRLYGATLGADTDKMGDTLVWRTGIIFVQDKFLPENIFADCARLLFDTVFAPACDGNGFDSDNFEREKRIQLEDIEGEINDKRTFARNRCLAEMCDGEPFGIPNLGTAEQVAALTREGVYNAWRKFLETAYFRVGVVADDEHPEVYGMFAERLANIERGEIYTPVETELHTAAGEIKRVSDRLDVAQGKLVLGCSVGGAGEDNESYRTMVMIDMLGGGAYSLLFNNVREKLSLCYYCAARYDKSTGMMMVDSGVETGNEEKAKEEILRQLKVVQEGDFEQDELDSTILTMVNALKSTVDTLGGLENWYLTQILSGSDESPLENVEKITAMTKERIQSAAKKITLDTVFFLAGKKEGEE